MKKRKWIFIIAIIVFIILIGVLIFNTINSPKEGKLISLSYNDVQEKVNNKDDFILIVSQTTCSHCASYKPKVKNIAKEYGIDIYYIDYDVDSNGKKFLEEFNLDGATPITLFINEGNETSILNRIEGDVSKSTALAKFKKMGFID